MSELRFRIELNKGRVGIPIPKLTSIADELMKFLIMLSEDVGMGGDLKNWIAKDFENNSLDFDCVKNDVESDFIANMGRDAFRSVVQNDLTYKISALIRPATRLQFSKVTSPIDADEVIRLGLYRNGAEQPEEWYSVDKTLASNIRDNLPGVSVYEGEIQGIVHALYKESQKPRIVLRELSSGDLIPCFFSANQYAGLIELLKDRQGIIFVEGEVREERATGKITEVKVSDFREAPQFSREFYESFIGSFPDATGDLTTEEYIEEYRTHHGAS